MNTKISRFNISFVSFFKLFIMQSEMSTGNLSMSLIVLALGTPRGKGGGGGERGCCMPHNIMNAVSLFFNV